MAHEFVVPSHDVLQHRWKFHRRGPDEIAHGRRAGGIERDCDDSEILVLQFFVKALPDWQVIAASSPGCPGGEEHLLAAIVRQPMHLAVEIGELEVGCLERCETRASCRRGFAEVPHTIRIIMHHGLSEMARQSREVECASSVANKFDLARRRNRNAYVAEARTLGLEFPSARPGGIGGAEPEVIALGPGAVEVRDAALMQWYPFARSSPS